MFRAPIMWYGTSRNFLPSTQPCLTQTSARSSLRPGAGVVLQEQVQHGHEVALARAEAAVQVGRLAVRRLDGGADEPQGVVEGGGELVGDDVVAQGRRGWSAVTPSDRLSTKSPRWTWSGRSSSSLIRVSALMTSSSPASP